MNKKKNNMTTPQQNVTNGKKLG